MSKMPGKVTIGLISLLLIGCGSVTFNSLTMGRKDWPSLRIANLPLERHEHNYKVAAVTASPVDVDQAKQIAVSFCGTDDSALLDSPKVSTLPEMAKALNGDQGANVPPNKVYVFNLKGYGGVMAKIHHESTKPTKRSRMVVVVDSTNGQVVLANAY